jgi:hypothetical protein
LGALYQGLTPPNCLDMQIHHRRALYLVFLLASSTDLMAQRADVPQGFLDGSLLALDVCPRISAARVALGLLASLSLLWGLCVRQERHRVQQRRIRVTLFVGTLLLFAVAVAPLHMVEHPLSPVIASHLRAAEWFQSAHLCPFPD